MEFCVKILQLIRYKNLLIIFAIQILSFHLYHRELAYLFEIGTFLLLLFSFLVSAGGYIINDICDIEIDQINKPSKQIVGKVIGLSQAWYIYGVVLLLGLCTALEIDLLLRVTYWVPLFAILSTICFSYSFWFKKRFLIGNIVVSLMSGLAVVIVLLPELIKGSLVAVDSPKFVLFLLIFSIFVTFFREIIKDVEDLEGDLLNDASTVPIVLGIKRTKKLLIVINIAICGLLIGFMQVKLISVRAVLFTTVIISAEILYCYLLKLVVFAEAKQDFSQISNLLKISMLLGLVIAALGA